MNEIQALRNEGFHLIKLKAMSKTPMGKWTGEEETRQQLRRNPNDFMNINVGVRCGMPLPGGGYLVVLDVDPRNSGDKSITGLQRAHGSLPPTFTVESGRGDGGKHYYFRSKKPIPKLQIGEGLDLQGDGRYVVGPGSLHPDTAQKYKIIENTEIADMPEWFYDVAHEDKTQLTGAFFDATKLQQPKEYESGRRNNLLTKEAGKLRRVDTDPEVMFIALQAINLKKCKPPLSEKEVKAICKSILRYEPQDKEPPVLKEVPKIIDTKNQEGDQVDFEKIFQEIYDDAGGVVKDIADEIMATSIRPYPQFAIASALSIVSTAAQGSYVGPIVGGTRGQSLSTYFWATAPSSAGKNAYLSAVNDYVKAIDPNLLVPNIGSSYGLRNHLYAQNTCVSVIDEAEETFSNLAKSQNQYIKEILVAMKILYNNVKELTGTIIKGKRYPSIKNPSYSIFAMGTESGFTAQLNGSIISGGLLSRFDIWPFYKVAFRQAAPDFKTNASIVLFLRKVYEVGQTASGKLQDFMDIFTAYEGKMEGKKAVSAPEHIAQFGNRKQMTITPEAEAMFIKFNKDQEKLYMKEVAANKELDSDLSPGSIHDRAGMKAQKFASLMAISCGHEHVEVADAEWGIKLAKVLADSLVATLGFTGGSFYEVAEKRIKAAIIRITNKRKTKDFKKRDLASNLKMSTKVIEPILVQMAIRDEVLIIDQLGQAVDMESSEKIMAGMHIRRNF